jgi:hypothetical protein
MRVNIQADVKEFTRKWNSTRRKKIPSIIRNTLNDLAMGSRTRLQQTLPKYVDKPTPFTLKSILFEKTDKHKLESKVGFLSATFPKKARRANIGTYPSDYMSLLTHGGTRLPKRKAIAVPTNSYKTNKFGNIKRGDIRRLLNKPNYFSDSIKGRDGIFKRDKKNNVTMVIAFEPETTYQGGYPFYSIVRHYVNGNFKKKFEKNFKQVFAREGI